MVIKVNTESFRGRGLTHNGQGEKVIWFYGASRYEAWFDGMYYYLCQSRFQLPKDSFQTKDEYYKDLYELYSDIKI